MSQFTNDGTSRLCLKKELEIVLMMTHLDISLIGLKLMRIFSLPKKETTKDYSTEPGQVRGYSSLNHLGKSPGTDMLLVIEGLCLKVYKVLQDCRDG